MTPYVGAIHAVTGQLGHHAEVLCNPGRRSGAARRGSAAPAWSVARARAGPTAPSRRPGLRQSVSPRPRRSPARIPLVEVAPHLGESAPERAGGEVRYARVLRALGALCGRGGLWTEIFAAPLRGDRRVWPGWRSLQPAGRLSRGHRGLLRPAALRPGAGCGIREPAPCSAAAAPGARLRRRGRSHGGRLPAGSPGARRGVQARGSAGCEELPGSAAVLGFALIAARRSCRATCARGEAGSLGRAAGRRVAAGATPHESGAVSAGQLRAAYYAGEDLRPDSGSGGGRRCSDVPSATATCAT